MKYRLGMSILVAGAASLYFPLNRTLTGGFNLSTPLDAWIPLWPIWVVPYLLCLPAWIGGLIWAAWKMDERLFRSFVSAGLFVLLSATLFYLECICIRRKLDFNQNFAKLGEVLIEAKARV